MDEQTIKVSRSNKIYLCIGTTKIVVDSKNILNEKIEYKS